VPLVFVVLGGFVLLALLEKSHSTIATGVTPTVHPSLISPASPVAPSIVIGPMPVPDFSGGNQTDAEVQVGFNAAKQATASIPVVSQFTSMASQIAGMFTAAHAAAVKREASTLNMATPTFVKSVTQTITALNARAISGSAAIDYLNQAQANYYSTVGGIIKKSAPCAIIPNTTNSNGPYNINGKYKCACNGTCNASCCIACLVVEPTVKNLTAIIQSGRGGKYSIATTQNNGPIQGTPEIYVTVLPAQ
jgi:hypothetical protein